MKLLVFSDSHGQTMPMERAVRLEQPEHVLHLGDYVRDARKLAEAISVPVTLVPGNCDDRCDQPEILTPVFCGRKFYMTHGHLHGVKMMYMRAIYAAMEAEADLLLFGHTHRPECFQEQGLWVMNPGSSRAGGSYGVIELRGDGISCCVKRME